MKKWIKKISISSGAIALVGTGVCVLVNNTQIRQTENQKTINKYQDDSFTFYGRFAATNRTYKLQLSPTSTNELYNKIDQRENSHGQGYTIIKYLILNWDIVQNSAKHFKQTLDRTNDLESVLSLFSQTNTHTWRGGFPFKSFMELLGAKAKNSDSITIYIYVDYVFLGHNLYGTSFF